MTERNFRPLISNSRSFIFTKRVSVHLIGPEDRETGGKDDVEQGAVSHLLDHYQ